MNKRNTFTESEVAEWARLALISRGEGAGYDADVIADALHIRKITNALPVLL